MNGRIGQDKYGFRKYKPGYDRLCRWGLGKPSGNWSIGDILLMAALLTTEEELRKHEELRKKEAKENGEGRNEKK